MPNRVKSAGNRVKRTDRRLIKLLPSDEALNKMQCAIQLKTSDALSQAKTKFIQRDAKIISAFQTS